MTRKSAKRRCLALLTSNAGLGETYQGALRWGVEQACSQHDADLFVYVGRTNWTRTGNHHKIYSLLDPGRIDAIVFVAGVIASHAPLREVVETIKRCCPVPFCAIGQHCDGVPNLLVDNAVGMVRLVDHLVEHHGYRDFIFISGPEGHEESEERLRGARASLAAHGLRLTAEAVMRGDFSISSGRDAARQLLRQGTKLEVVVCANDDMAIGVLEALTAAGLRCPGDVVVTGFDDTAAARFSYPPLTSVRQPATELGSLAVNSLIRMLNGEPPFETVRLPTEVIIRESCGCPTGSLVLLSPEMSNDEALLASPEKEINRLLAHQYDDDDRRDRWTRALIASVVDETKGVEGAFVKILDEMVSSSPNAHLSLYNFQNIIDVLCRWSQARNESGALRDVFQSARIVLGNHMYRRSGAKQLRNDALVDALRISGERFTTSLSLQELKSNLLRELPKLGVSNGHIALFESMRHELLVPWVCFREGTPLEFPNTPYRAALIVPEIWLPLTERQSYTVLPLTFEAELFGIAVLELPLGFDAYQQLREQIGSALWAVRKREETIAQERMRLAAEEERLLTNERLRSLSVIGGGVAHDLNNVLGPLMALPDAMALELRQNPTVPPEIFEDLALIRQASLRAAHTIGDLFLLGRTHESPRTYFSLNHLLVKEADAFSSAPGYDKVIVEISIEAENLVILGSKPHLVRAVSNLVLNSARAVDGKGTIRIVAKRVALDSPLAGQPSIPRGEYAVVEVHDNGCGIPKEHLPHIMEPFFTVRRASEKRGSGLGLAIVHRIVRESNGYIRVESEPNVGSTFSLYFPLADRQVAPSEPPEAAAGGRETLLVVDDETVQLRTASRILKHLGYRVTTAQSGEEAIRLLDDGTDATFDLVIVDMLMPGLDGLETVAQLRQRRPGLKAVVASGYAPEQTSFEATRRGLVWLAKPYTLPALAAAVRAALKTS